MRILIETARFILSRTHPSGAPCEALELYRMAIVGAKARGHEQIDTLDVEEVFAYQEIDELGLRWMDREVIRALLTQPKYRKDEFVCYGASEANVCTLAGVDKAEYRESIRPRLMSRGLLVVRPYYGQALTEKAVSMFSR